MNSNLSDVAQNHKLGAGENLRVVSLEGCYHGDTLGAMDVATPNPFNARQHPWFQSKVTVFFYMEIVVFFCVVGILV